MLQILRRICIFVLVVFLLPVGAASAWWISKDHPEGWHMARWTSSGILPAAARDKRAAIYVLAARTGGLKGALAVHSWIVLKKAGSESYDRYDKVGWGAPIRKNRYAADAAWYSNDPWVVQAVVGKRAERLIGKVEAAIASYPYAGNGGYRIWPGPNSNSFIAHVLDSVPALGAQLPPNAVGRDFAPGLAAFRLAPDWRDMHATIGGLIGFAIGMRSGIEIHFLGLAAGVDILHPALKLPGLGRIDLVW